MHRYECAGGLLAGVGRKDISPPEGIPHAGWGAQTHKYSEGADLELRVTALALQQGDITIAVLDVDVGAFLTPRADEIRDLIACACGISRGNVRLSYTHTHAGVVPANFVRLGREEMVAAYYELLKWQCVAAAKEALAKLSPANVAIGIGESDIAVNRRLKLEDGRIVVGQNPQGTTDHSLIAVRIDNPNESPLAAIVTYGCHPIILGHENTLISPDFPGVMKRGVESVFGAPCLFLQGCAGDQMPVQAFTADRCVSRRLGTILAADALSVLSRLRTRRSSLKFDRIVESGAPLALYREAFESPARAILRIGTRLAVLPLRPGLASVAEAESIFSQERASLAEVQATRPNSSSEIAAAMFRVKRAEIALGWSRRLAGREEVEIELQCIRIGPLALVGFPGEPFAEIGVRLRNLSPLAFTHLGGYTNGHSGYVPSREAFEEGGYEAELGCRFTPEVGDILVRESLALIETLVDGE